MFRQEEAFIGGWRDKTIESIQRRRFDQLVAQMTQLGAQRLESLSTGAFTRKLEQCWQDVPRKPMRLQQVSQIWETVIRHVDLQADCLSHEEHELVERALILGGSVQIEDVAELEAAHALSLRLWAHMGLVSGKPFMELERPILSHVDKAFSRSEHAEIRAKFRSFQSEISSALYCVGAMDDRKPQQTILREVLSLAEPDETALQLARRYLWASFDCVDYSDGVLLVHAALTDPALIDAFRRRRSAYLSEPAIKPSCAMDILPEEIPLQTCLENAIAGGLRSGLHAHDVARSLRFLCKQGAPLSVLEEILQASLIILMNNAMRRALSDLYYLSPKWGVFSNLSAHQ